jgi:RNA polymerase sigma-70 factor, ECF subfamily
MRPRPLELLNFEHLASCFVARFEYPGAQSRVHFGYLTPSPKELLDAAISGDTAARSQLFEEHFASLRTFVRGRLGKALRSREQSEDIAQSVVREALEDLDRLENRGLSSFRRWLFLRAENKIKDRGRFWKRERRTSARETPIERRERSDSGSHRGVGEVHRELLSLATPSRIASAREELVRVESAFAKLPDDYQRVILLARFGGFSHDEISVKLGRTSLATRTLLSRAMARLSLLLEEKSSPSHRK